MPPRVKVNVGRVRQLVAQGVAHRDVAERLGVSRSVVSRVAMGIYRESPGKPAGTATRRTERQS